MIICVLNYRGGSGKTTSVINIGSGLVRKGKKVLLVDVDPQKSLSEAIVPNNDKIDIVDLMLEEKLDSTNIFHHPEEGYDLISGNSNVGLLESKLPPDNKEFRLKQALDKIKQNYDFVLIDTSPAISFLNLSALIASDYVIIPAKADPFSISGIKKINESIKSVKHLNPNIKILGVLITQFKNTVIQKKLLELIKHITDNLKIKLFRTAIRENNAVLESITFRKSILSYSPKANGAKDYMTITEELLETLKQSEED